MVFERMVLMAIERSRYRRGLAYEKLQLAEAADDLLAAAKLQPGDKAVRKAYTSVKPHKKKWRSRCLSFAKGPGCGPVVFSVPKLDSGVTAFALHEAVWGAGERKLRIRTAIHAHFMYLATDFSAFFVWLLCTANVAVSGVRSRSNGGGESGEAVVRSAVSLASRCGVYLSLLCKQDDAVERVLPPACGGGTLSRPILCVLYAWIESTESRDVK